MSRPGENAMKTYGYVQNVMELRARIVSMTNSSRSVMVIVVDAMFINHPYLTYPPYPPLKIINHNYFNGPIPLFDSSKKAIDIWK